MKSALLLGTTLATTIAAGPKAGRQLDTAWNLDGGISDNATGGSSGCVFRSTNDLFDHEFKIIDEYSADGAKVFDEDGAENTNVIGQATYASWETAPIVLARFEVRLDLKNYVAATSGATANYKFYDYHTAGTGAATGWVNTALSATGQETMTKVCLYKNSNSACTPGDYMIELDDHSSGTGIDTEGAGNADNEATTSNQNTSAEKTLKLGLRKILGIATTCGESGDLDGSLDSASDNIFVWADLNAVSDTTFKLTYDVNQGNDDQSADPSGDLTGSATYVTYSVNVANSKPETHDLLFIEAPHEYQETLFTSHPDKDNNGKTEYRVDYHTGFEADGGITITGVTSSQTCGVTLSVNSQRNNHWHCFRDANAMKSPDSDSTLFSDEEGIHVGATGLAALTTETMSNNGKTACTAQLVVDCTSGVGTVSGEDTRKCAVPGAGGSGTDPLDTLQDWKDCTDSEWFTNAPSYYVDKTMIAGSYSSAIVQAVRLDDNRRYPHNAESSAYQDVSVKFGLKQISQFMCGDDTCATEDPFVVLDANKVTIDLEFAGIGPFNTKKDETLRTGECDKCLDSDTSSYTTCTGATPTTSCDANGPDYDSGAVNLVNPPSGFPEAYLFGIVSFDMNSYDASGAANGGANPKTEMIEAEDGNQPPTTATRRLSSMPQMVPSHTTLLVNAVQNVIQK